MRNRNPGNWDCHWTRLINCDFAQNRFLKGLKYRFTQFSTLKKTFFKKKELLVDANIHESGYGAATVTLTFHVGQLVAKQQDREEH